MRTIPLFVRYIMLNTPLEHSVTPILEKKGVEYLKLIDAFFASENTTKWPDDLKDLEQYQGYLYANDSDRKMILRKMLEKIQLHVGQPQVTMLISRTLTMFARHIVENTSSEKKNSIVKEIREYLEQCGKITRDTKYVKTFEKLSQCMQLSTAFEAEALLNLDNKVHEINSKVIELIEEVKPVAKESSEFTFKKRYTTIPQSAIERAEKKTKTRSASSKGQPTNGVSEIDRNLAELRIEDLLEFYGFHRDEIRDIKKMQWTEISTLSVFLRYTKVLQFIKSMTRDEKDCFYSCFKDRNWRQNLQTELPVLKPFLQDRSEA